MLLTGNPTFDAERAFTRAARARRRAKRRAALGRLLRRVPCCSPCLQVLTGRAPGGGPGRVQVLRVDDVTATLEPGRAAVFDRDFRPHPAVRERWQRVWLAEQRGTVLPPIEVVRAPGGGYAVADGHHRLSVARARGARTIDALVTA